MATTILAAVGDVLIDRMNPENALEGIKSILDAADLVFGNFEGVMSDRHTAAPGMSTATIVPPSNAAPLGVFDVMSLANNHAMDAGGGGLAETMGILSAHGVRTAGAGPDADTAARPVLLGHGDRTVAFVACASVMVVGTQAGPRTPGVAPLRAEDCYTAPFPGHLVPGVPAKVVSVLNEHDWARVEQTVQEARAGADLVVASVHWGDHTRPWVITEHERLCAELLVEAGADLVLGHHHHLLRGVQFVDGTPVFYGLGHLVFDLPRQAEELRERGIDPDSLGEDGLAEALGEFGIYPRPGADAAFPFHPWARITAVAVAELTDGGVSRCGLVPCLIGGDGVARPVGRDHPRWSEVSDHVRRACARPRLGTEVVDDGTLFAGHPLLVMRDAGEQER